MRKKEVLIWVCPNCGSDNVRIREWTNPNTGQPDLGNSVSDEDCYCIDCKTSKMLGTTIIPVRKKVIGFQVINAEPPMTFHPDTKHYQVYSLQQAFNIMNLSIVLYSTMQFKLHAVWSGDIENPLMMFTGDMRE
jgi:hypothetical protein